MFRRALGMVVAAVVVLGLGAAAPAAEDPYVAARAEMVRRQIAARGVKDPRVLAAMRDVPRHLFVPRAYRPAAYWDRPLPIGHDQTISQPYIVAVMTEALALKPGGRVLEVGTGSGYQAAVLARLGAEVFTIEIVTPLCREARARLRELGYKKVAVRCGDGHRGWPERAPFDGIIVTCAPERIPPALIAQLRPGGRLVIPVGPVRDVQRLVVVEKGGDGRLTQRTMMLVRFVPMTGGR